MFVAKPLPYSSVLGQTVTLHKEENGPAIAIINVRPVEATDAFDFKVQSQNLARLLVERFNSHD